MRSSSYTLTRSAESDLDDLYLRSLERYGRDQTNLFIADLKKAAEFAVAHHGKIPTRSHLTGDSGLSLYPVNGLYIAYRPVADDHIVIIAILNQSRDIPAFVIAEANKFQEDFLEIERKIKQGEIIFRTP